MQQTIEAVFDGEVLRPDEPLALVPNTRYRIMIDAAIVTGSDESEPGPGILDDIVELAVDFGIPDLAAQWEHYAYGAPKQ